MAIARALLVPFGLFAAAGLVIAALYMTKDTKGTDNTDFVDKNPLELGTAFLFAGLFVIMMLLTSFVMHHYGNTGLRALSFAVGFTDIDPFVLSILTGKYSVVSSALVSAVMIAAGSNNILKALYALWFGGLKEGWQAAVWIGLLGVGTIAWAFMLP